MKPPMSAQEQFIAAITPHCEHTSLKKPECCCHECIREILTRHAPELMEQSA